MPHWIGLLHPSVVEPHRRLWSALLSGTHCIRMHGYTLSCGIDSCESERPSPTTRGGDWAHSVGAGSPPDGHIGASHADKRTRSDEPGWMARHAGACVRTNASS